MMGSYETGCSSEICVDGLLISVLEHMMRIQFIYLI